jgi:hypothetical protein
MTRQHKHPERPGGTASAEQACTLSWLHRLLPPDEALKTSGQHFLQSGIELLKGVQTLVGGYLARLEACAEGKEDRPQRVSRIEIKEKEEEA